MTILELADQAGIKPKWAASTAGGEYHSSCPACGGTDRFYIQPFRQMRNCLGFYSCRRCGAYGDAIQFARQFLNYSFQEAAQITNATLPETTHSPSMLLKQNNPPILKAPSKEWITKATSFVDQANRALLHKQDMLQYLAERGLPLSAVERYKIGWSNQDIFFSREEWGLAGQCDDARVRSLWIPKGLVIPTIELNRNVIRLKVRRSNWHNNDKLPKYVAISGGMNGLSIIGNTKNSTMIVVEAELDAYAIDYAAHDFAFTIAVGSNIKNPDNVTNRLAQNAPHLLICHDNDEAGKRMLTKWQRLYPHAIAYSTPLGKDIGEAKQKGLNLRAWLYNAIARV